MEHQSVVDQTAIKFSQFVIAAGIVVAAIAGATWLVAVLAAALAASAASPAHSPFRLLYRRVAVPLGVARPRPAPDDPAPHRFAQGVGAVCLTGAVALFAVNAATAAWLLAGLVAVLAMLNAVAGFCAGCFIYYQLERRGWLPRRPSAT